MVRPAPEQTSRDEAIALLAPALGEEKARETVDAAASALGLGPSGWSSSQMRGVFAHISMESGLVGITARVVARRLKHVSDVHAIPPSSGHVAAVPAPPPSANRTFETSRKPVEAIADLIAQALGVEQAKREVDRAAQALGYGDLVHFSEALKILEHLAKEPGLVGIAAQFAKTRLHLLTW
jgi:hypothetical protein